MRRLLLAALCAAIPALFAGASTIRLRSLPEAVDEAQQVLQGRVVSARGVRDGSILVTEYEIEVSEWIKPAGGPPRVTILQPGGTVDGTTMVVVGAAHFEPGQELILFTRDYSGRGRQQVVNLSQGALGLETPAPGSSGEPSLPGAASFPDRPPGGLRDFKARVRALAAAASP